MKVPTLPNLDGLIALSRTKGVDIRPTLVRVLTDLYVQKAAHTREEESRYTELALSLLGAVDVPTRAAVARKLANYGSAPRPVLHRLARDAFEVAEPILAHSTVLGDDELQAVADACGGLHAAAIAARASTRLSGGEDPIFARAGEAMENLRAAGEPAVTQAAQSVAAAADAGETDAELGERFLAAGPAGRRVILANLESSAAAPPDISPAAPAAVISRLEGAALQRRPEDFARELEHALRLAPQTARQIAFDATGEAVVAVGKALGMQAPVLVRVLLFLNPAIGHSVDRLYALMRLHEELSPRAAAHLVATWRRPQPAERPRARYQPVTWSEERQDRRRLPGDPARSASAGQAAARQPGAGETHLRAERHQGST